MLDGISILFKFILTIPYLPRFNVDLTPYPLMTAIEERLSQLPAFKAAHPNQQPDCPPDT